VEIVAFRYRERWILAAGVHPVRGTQIATCTWNHPMTKWVRPLENGTQFGTEAAALVYRKANLERMKLALEDAPL
jgi:hypothetical protein